MAAPSPAPGTSPHRLDVPREMEDLALLGLALAIVPAGWVLLGWRWPLCACGYDAWATALPLLDALREAGGDWGALAYRPELLGGARLRDSVGPNPLVALLARTGLHATGIYDLAAFALQALIGFFGARAASDLARGWGARAPAAREWALRTAAVVLCAFAPALGWRLGYGHLAMTTGLLPFAAALALVAAAAARRTTLTLLLTSALAVANGLLFTGHQLVLYGAVFGLPVLAGLWLSARAPRRALAAPAAALLAGLLLALPALWAVLGHAFGGDSPRPPTGLRITYSYLTAGPLDWLTSVPWTRAAIPGHRPPLHHHESNVPLGPLLALLALVPWRRARPLAWGLGIGAALVLAFSMDVKPVSTLLVGAIPPLGSFRVPTRAALPLVLALPPVAIAALWGAASTGHTTARAPLLQAAGAAALAALFLAPPPLREGLGWAVASLAAAAAWRGRLAGGAAAAAAVALAGGALGAFGERLLLPFRDTEALLARARAIGAQAVTREPVLAGSLTRVALDGGIPELGANTAFAAGLSSLDGYFFPSRRLLALVGALRRQAYDPSGFVVRVRPDEPAARVLFALYDVRWAGRNAAAEGTPPAASVPSAVPPPGPDAPWRLELEPLGATAGPAWFSRSIEAVPDLEALAARLRDGAGPLPPRLRETVLLARSDRLAAGLAAPPPQCAGASVSSVSADRHGRIAAQIRTPAGCPLTVAANFTESLRGRVRVGGEWSDARLFPAYGALLGVWVPAGATEVRVEAR